MRSVMAAIAVLLLLVGSAPVFAGQTERDIVDRFLSRAQKKHTHHLSWVAGNFGMNRITARTTTMRSPVTNRAISPTARWNGWVKRRRSGLILD